MKRLIDALINKKWTISCAESLTGGLFASTLTSFAGVSQVFKGGIVSYSNETKRDVLGVKKYVIDEIGVVSSECASQMARQAKEKFKTDISISFTGNAGPSSMEGKPVGLVYIGLCIGETTFSFEYLFQGNREEIRNQCVSEGIKKILELI